MTNHPADDYQLGTSVPLSPMTVALNEVEVELKSASAKFPPMSSPHEGYAIMLEEVDELWDEVKKNPKIRSVEKMRAEAKQVAAMALRFMIDCTSIPACAGFRAERRTGLKDRRSGNPPRLGDGYGRRGVGADRRKA